MIRCNQECCLPPHLYSSLDVALNGTVFTIYTAWIRCPCNNTSNAFVSPLAVCLLLVLALPSM